MKRELAVAVGVTTLVILAVSVSIALFHHQVRPAPINNPEIGNSELKSNTVFDYGEVDAPHSGMLLDGNDSLITDDHPGVSKPQTTTAFDFGEGEPLHSIMLPDGNKLLIMPDGNKVLIRYDYTGDGEPQTQSVISIEETVAAEMKRQEENPGEPPPQNQDGIVAELAGMERARIANEKQTEIDIPKVREDLAKIEGAGFQTRAEIIRNLCEYRSDARRAFEVEIRAYMNDPFPLVQVAAAGVICKLEPYTGTLEVLIGHLDDVDPQVRRMAAWELTRHSSTLQPATIAPLVDALQDSDYSVRRCAAQGLGNMHRIAQEAAPDLLAALKDEDVFVRVYSSSALSMIEPYQPAVIPALMGMVNDPDTYMRRHAFQTLGRIGEKDKRILPFLLGFLDGSDNEAVALALGALEHMRAAEARPYAERLHDSPDKDISRAAWRVLRYVGEDGKRKF